MSPNGTWWCLENFDDRRESFICAIDKGMFIRDGTILVSFTGPSVVFKRVFCGLTFKLL